MRPSWRRMEDRDDYEQLVSASCRLVHHQRSIGEKPFVEPLSFVTGFAGGTAFDSEIEQILVALLDVYGDEEVFVVDVAMEAAMHEHHGYFGALAFGPSAISNVGTVLVDDPNTGPLGIVSERLCYFGTSEQWAIVANREAGATATASEAAQALRTVNGVAVFMPVSEAVTHTAEFTGDRYLAAAWTGWTDLVSGVALGQ